MNGPAATERTTTKEGSAVTNGRNDPDNKLLFMAVSFMGGIILAGLTSWVAVWGKVVTQEDMDNAINRDARLRHLEQSFAAFTGRIDGKLEAIQGMLQEYMKRTKEELKH